MHTELTIRRSRARNFVRFVPLSICIIDLTISPVHQLKIARPTVLFAHPDNVPIALDTIGQLGLSRSQLVLLEDASAARDASALPTVHSLIHDSEHDKFAPYVEHRFEAGEARTAVAFLCFSSGTTGLPKVRGF